MSGSQYTNILVATAFISALFSSEAIFGQTSTDEVRFKPEQLNFSSVGMGKCRPRKIEAINSTDSAIPDPEFRIEEGVAFVLQKRGKCPNPLEPGRTCRAYVNFCPPLFYMYTDTLTFSGSDRKIPLSGRGHGGGR